MSLINIVVILHSLSLTCQTVKTQSLVLLSVDAIFERGRNIKLQYIDFV